MSWFGKKKKKEEEDDEEYEDEEEESDKSKKPLRRRVKNKDFKDLNPEARKRRKEPEKPWGKKERLLILSLVLLTAGASGFLALSAREYKLPGLPRIKLPALSDLDFLGEETIILEGENDDLVKANKVKTEFNELTQNLSGVYGLYVIRLDSGYSYGVNENEEFTPASLNKLPAIAGFYVEAERGDLNLNDTYELKTSDKLAGSGSLQTSPAGTRLTNRELAELMAKESDNTAFNISRKILGGGSWEDWLRGFLADAGMTNSKLSGENQSTTPKDIASFFKELYAGNIVSQDAYREEIYDYLTDTIYEDWLAAGIKGSQFAHKYGREIHVVNDAGIVFSGGKKADADFVLVVLSKGVIEKEADRVFPLISDAVYEIETGN